MINENKKAVSLRSNVIALAIVQVSNYIIPLISLPYLARILGVDSFGVLVLAQTFMMYFILLVEYGFSWSATRRVAVCKNDPELLGQIFINVWFSQWVIVFFSSLIIVFGVFFLDVLNKNANTYLLAFTIVPATVFFPLWFFQGVEKLKVAAYFQLTGKAIGIVLIFVFVKNTEDVSLVLLINSSTTFFVGLLSIIYIYKNNLFIFSYPNFNGVRIEFKEGLSLFVSRISISLYTLLIPLILGWVSGPAALAYFNVADKIRMGAQSLINPICQALFPRISSLISEENNDAVKLLRKGAVAVFLVSLVASLCILLGATYLVSFVGGPLFDEAVPVLQIMSFIPLFVGVSSFCGVQIMIPLQMNRVFNNILFSAAIFSLCICFPLINSKNALGAALTIFVVEFFVAFVMVFFLIKKYRLKKSFF